MSGAFFGRSDILKATTRLQARTVNARSKTSMRKKVLIFVELPFFMFDNGLLFSELVINQFML